MTRLPLDFEETSKEGVGVDFSASGLAESTRLVSKGSAGMGVETGTLLKDHTN